MKCETPDKKRSFFPWLAGALALFLFNSVIAGVASMLSMANDSVSLINGVCELGSRLLGDDSQTGTQPMMQSPIPVQVHRPQASSWEVYNPSTGKTQKLGASEPISSSWDTNWGYDDPQVIESRSPAIKPQANAEPVRLATAEPVRLATVEPYRMATIVPPNAPTATIWKAPVATAIQADWGSGWGSSN